MPLPFVAKIPKSSMGEGVFLIENQTDWNRYLQLTQAIYAQEYLSIDRDLRIVWVGDQIVGGYWRLQAEQRSTILPAVVRLRVVFCLQKPVSW